MKRAHKIRLKPTKQQEAYFQRAAGTARFAYNWALDTWQKQYEQDLKPTAFKLKKELNQLKKKEFPWMSEVTKCAPEQALIDLGRAFTNFFRKISKYPKFKKKGLHDSFYLSNDTFELKDKKVRIPKLGWVKMTEQLRFQGKILSARVSRKAGYWFIAIQMEIPDPVFPTVKNHDVVGLDFGINTLIMTSENQAFLAPKPLKQNLKKLRRLQKSLHRKVKGSNNRYKARQKLSRLYYKIDNIRKDYLHKLTTKLASTCETLVLEDLNVSGMLRNRRLSRAISDLGFYELKRQFLYKKQAFGGGIFIADRWFPSSKTCNNCGTIKEKLSLGNRTFTCTDCGYQQDRDLNAALNLRTAGSAGSQACGQMYRWDALVAN